MHLDYLNHSGHADHDPSLDLHWRHFDAIGGELPAAMFRVILPAETPGQH